MKLALLLITVLWLVFTDKTYGNGNHTNTDNSPSNTTSLPQSVKPSSKPKSEVELLLRRLKSPIHDLALMKNTSLSQLLKRTWFQIAEVSPGKLKTIGFIDALPFRPSDSLIRLLSSLSIAELEVSYACISNDPALSGKNYTYTMLDYLFTVLRLDTKNQTMKILKALPVGEQSVAQYLKVSDDLLKKQRYLTDVYPKIKAAIAVIVQGTSLAYYRKNPLEKLPYTDSVWLLGSNKVQRVENVRLKYAKGVINSEPESMVSFDRAIMAIRTTALFEKWTVIYESLLTPLKSMVFRVSVTNISISDALLRCINATKEFSLQNMYTIRNPTLLNGITIGNIASFLNISVQSLSRYSMLEMLNMSANAETNSVVPIVIFAFQHQIYLDELAGLNLLELGKKIMIIPHPRYLSDSNFKNKLKNVTIKELPEILTKKLNKKVNINWVRITPYAFLMDALLISPMHADLMKNMHKGLRYMWSNVQIGMIMKLLAIKQIYKDHYTLVNFAHDISSISHGDMASLFNLDKSQENLLNSAFFHDIKVLLSYHRSSKKLEDFTPYLLSNWLFSLPPKSKKLLSTLQDIANAKGTSLPKMSLSDDAFFGKWGYTDMNSLLSAVNVPRSFYVKIKIKTFDSLSRILHTPMESLKKFNVIKVVKALCTYKNRFNGSTCIHFSGCSSLSTPCDSNADCIDIIGSYFCRCKTGFNGNGKTCQEDVVKNENDKSPETKGFTTLEIVGIFIGSSIGVIGLGITIAKVRRRIKK